ncbi:hypothetical protein HQ531_09890 [bacterium]|nr:hypothetical protein [bacterium]
MTTKEKLDLLWKYLLLIVLVYGFANIGRSHAQRVHMNDCDRSSHHGMMGYGSDDCDFEDMDINVDVENLIDGDSTLIITINGETMDIKDFETKHGNVFMKKMKGHGRGAEKRIKIIKKELDKDQ